MQLFVTGGTIDKKYNELNGELIFDQTAVPAMLAQGRCRLPINVETLLLKDSLEMNDDDRALILKHCVACDETQVVITHGTDTMTNTAEVLGKAMEAGTLAPKSIVLLGAMVPYAFKQSDALFNLGCAIAGAQALPAGVYISMNGQLFPWEDVKKNRELGEFQSQS